MDYNGYAESFATDIHVTGRAATAKTKPDNAD